MADSINGMAIRLTPERWGHICTGHPEMATMYNSVLDTIAAPDLIQHGDNGELLAIRLYPSTPLTSKHVVVVYRETFDDGFVITAYLTSRPSAMRLTVWKC